MTYFAFLSTDILMTPTYDISNNKEVLRKSMPAFTGEKLMKQTQLKCKTNEKETSWIS